MNNKDVNLLQEIDRRILENRAELAALQKARDALAGINGAAGVVTAAPRQKAVKAPERAPNGALKTAIAEVIAATPGLTNGQVREALKQARYQHSTQVWHVSKTLTAMVKRGQVMKKDEGGARRYYPVSGA